MNYYLFQLLEGVDPEMAQEELRHKGLKEIFLIEDDLSGEILIGGHSRKKIEAPFAILREKKRAEVNWEEQWSLYSQDFYEGKAHIQVGEKELLLIPGPGFGDLSHPTTALMLEIMQEHVPNEHIIDIGTGSGILALAALLLGAKSVIGIDIDAKALTHARKNAKINQLKATFKTQLPKKIAPQNVMLMNMIFPEQIQVEPQQFNSFAKLWIISGILKTQKEAYLAQANSWGWRPLLQREKCGWLAMIFTS